MSEHGGVIRTTENEGVSKAASDSTAFKQAFYNKDLAGKSPRAKGNRKIVNRNARRGQRRGALAGMAAGSLYGAYATHRVGLGPVIGGAIGALGGAEAGMQIGGAHGQLRGTKMPGYVTQAQEARRNAKAAPQQADVEKGLRDIWAGNAKGSGIGGGLGAAAGAVAGKLTHAGAGTGAILGGLGGGTVGGTAGSVYGATQGKKKRLARQQSSDLDKAIAKAVGMGIVRSGEHAIGHGIGGPTIDAMNETKAGFRGTYKIRTEDQPPRFDPHGGDSKWPRVTKRKVRLSPSGQYLLHAVPVAGGVGAATATTQEVRRRRANKQGAKVSPTAPYLHPHKTNATYDKLYAKKIQAKRKQWAAQDAAQGKVRKSATEGVQEMGVSAFGVDHGNIEKASLGGLGRGIRRMNTKTITGYHLHGPTNVGEGMQYGEHEVPRIATRGRKNRDAKLQGAQWQQRLHNEFGPTAGSAYNRPIPPAPAHSFGASRGSEVDAARWANRQPGQKRMRAGDLHSD